ncbi:unnamed protein product [Amoebophrya sp. A120]|nr:unnamed protein product [Amoebophrya sp. A120]|eukprot:GSA120T00011795001.1
MAEEVSSEFECALCLRLLLEPVSVSCGHTFCRSCIEASLDHRAACPLCRQPIIAGRSVNVLIQNLIQQRYPQTLRARQEEQLEEIRDDEQQRAGANTTAISPDRDAAGATERRNVPMFASSRLYQTNELLFPGAEMLFKATEMQDEHILDHLLATSREFVMQYEASAGAGSGDDEARNGGASNAAGTANTANSSTTGNSVGYLFQVESAERDPQDETRMVQCRCKERVWVRGMRFTTRPETGTGMRICDIVPMKDGAIDVAELVLPTAYQPLRLDPMTGKRLGSTSSTPPQQEDAPPVEAQAGTQPASPVNAEGPPDEANGGIELTPVLNPATRPIVAPPDVRSRNLASIADECVIYLNFHLERLGPHARQRFIRHHGPVPMRVARSVMQLRDIEQLSWYLCRVLVATDDRKTEWFKSTDLKLRLCDCLQVFRECGKPGACLQMPGSAAWMKLGSHYSSLLLLVIVLLLLYLKGSGHLDALERSRGRGKYVIDFDS